MPNWHGHPPIRLAGEQNLAGVMLTLSLHRQHAHVDQRAVVLLDRHRHVMVVRQQPPIDRRHFRGLHFGEIAQEIGARRRSNATNVSNSGDGHLRG